MITVKLRDRTEIICDTIEELERVLEKIYSAKKETDISFVGGYEPLRGRASLRERLDLERKAE